MRGYWRGDGGARALMIAVGQEPITVLREIDGFILSRLQGALLNEAMRLVADGYVTTEDLDKTVCHGLGLRWSFMGPMETIDLNAPDGVPEYCARYGPIYYRVAQEATPRPYDEKLFAQVAKDRRAILPMDRHAERQAWRDPRLMALAAHKRKAAKEIGSSSAATMSPATGSVTKDLPGSKQGGYRPLVSPTVTQFPDTNR